MRRRADRGAVRAGRAPTLPTSWRSRSSGTRSCTTCSWGSTRRSWAARRSRWPRTAPSIAARPTSICTCHPGRARLPAAMHRRPRRRGHRRGHLVRGAVPTGDREPDRRRRDERRDRAGQQRPDARRLQPHRPGVRGGADQLRPACGARARSSACASTSETLEPRFTRDRGRPLVRRDRLRRVDGHGRVRLRDHRGDRRDVPGRHPDDRRGDRRRARGAHAPDRSGRPDVLLRGARRRAPPGHHAERRPADPAREGGALRGMPAADGHTWGSPRSTASGWPARSARTSILSTRWSSGWCRTAIPTT